MVGGKDNAASGSGGQGGSGSGDLDVMSTIKDPNVKEIVAKESLQYKPTSAEVTKEIKSFFAS